MFGDLGSNLTSDRVKASVALCVFLCLHLSFSVHVHVFQRLWHGSVSLRLANFAPNLPDAECDTTCGVLSSPLAQGRC